MFLVTVRELLTLIVLIITYLIRHNKWKCRVLKPLFHLQLSKMVVVISLKLDSINLEIFSNLKDSEKCLVNAGVFLFPKLFQEFCNSQSEGKQMCAGSSIGVPGTPCASASWVLPQPLERDAHRWKALWANATCQLLGF